MPSTCWPCTQAWATIVATLRIGRSASGVMRRYLIVYRDRSPVEIVRVLSGYRDIATLLA